MNKYQKEHNPEVVRKTSAILLDAEPDAITEIEPLTNGVAQSVSSFLNNGEHRILKLTSNSSHLAREIKGSSVCRSLGIPATYVIDDAYSYTDKEGAFAYVEPLIEGVDGYEFLKKSTQDDVDGYMEKVADNLLQLHSSIVQKNSIGYGKYEFDRNREIVPSHGGFREYHDEKIAHLKEGVRSKGVNKKLVRRAIKYLEDRAQHVGNKALTICHGDVNPGNTIISSDGTVSLIDFDTGMEHPERDFIQFAFTQHASEVYSKKDHKFPFATLVKKYRDQGGIIDVASFEYYYMAKLISKHIRQPEKKHVGTMIQELLSGKDLFTI